jgi:hypothetical protein
VKRNPRAQAGVPVPHELERSKGADGFTGLKLRTSRRKINPRTKTVVG